MLFPFNNIVLLLSLSTKVAVKVPNFTWKHSQRDIDQFEPTRKLYHYNTYYMAESTKSFHQGGCEGT